MTDTARRFRIGAVEVILVVEASEPLLRPAELYPESTPESISAQRAWMGPALYDAASDRLVITMQGFSCAAAARPSWSTVAWATASSGCGRTSTAGNGTGSTGCRPRAWRRRMSTSCSRPTCTWITWAGIPGGWVGRAPTFPRARYLFVEPEYAYWSSDAGRQALQRTGDYVEDSVRPIFEAGLADLVPSDHRIDEAIALVHTPGHTPGHVCVAIDSEGQQALITGDLLHHPLQCRFPHWSTRFCFDADQARATRLAFLQQHARQRTLLFPAHFPDPTAGRLRCVPTAEGTHYAYDFIPHEGPGTA
jgi:hypothetical protein